MIDNAKVSVRYTILTSHGGTNWRSVTDEALVGEVRTICDVTRTALGPFGANKLLVQSDGTVTATASATELLGRLDVTDPAAALLDSAASGFDERHSDGTGTLVTLAGALLEAADRLSDQGLHPTAIERGYEAGRDIALGTVDRSARPLSSFAPEDVARTALTSTRDPRVRQSVAEQAATAVEHTGADRDVTVVSRLGGSVSETELIEGTVIPRGGILESMPRSPDRDGVAVLSSTVDVPHVGSQLGRVTKRVIFEADSFEDRYEIAEMETAAFKAQLDAAVDAGCGTVVTERAINERIQSVLAARDLLGIQRVDTSELREIARATGATVVPTLSEVDETVLGTGSVEVQRTAGRDMTLFRSEAGETTYTLFCRAPDPRSVTAFEESVGSALAATATAVRDGRVVPGGGAVEANAASALSERTREIDGRHQLAADAFGEALMTVPHALGQTAGLDGGQTIVRLRVARSEGRDSVGIDALAGETADVLGTDPIVEPVPTKRAVLSASTDLAIQLLRIDERHPATDLSDDDIEVPEEGSEEGEQSGSEADHSRSGFGV